MPVEPVQPGQPMTREWLQDQSEAQLRRLAGQVELDGADSMSRAELIDALEGTILPD